ncbi:MAG: hypothetical protein MZV63_41300 [Marinilabiliales bacterium]|nr:hypothetical protein [Marinilabiliales bacterium]
MDRGSPVWAMVSGTVNWTDVPEPVHHFGQQPRGLVFTWWRWPVRSFWVIRRVPLHLLQSIFTLPAIFFFYRISLIVCPKYPKFLTLLFALCPAFPRENQNLMTDVPLGRTPHLRPFI